MKKILSLALALVMTVSLFTFAPASASAAFTDSGSITYKEAVDVIYSLEIMGGYSDGSFRPNGPLTRGAAAKIICNMMLTPQIAGNMSNDTGTKFKDVPKGHVFAGYIAWCVQEGIVSGYSDGTFHPGDSLTAQAFLKMLLCALGYDATIEHYTGSGWSNNVINQSLMIGLNNGLANTLNGPAMVNRQDACLFAFNTLKSDLVEYTGNRNNRAVRTTTAERGTYITAEAASPYTLQFAEQYFSDLKQAANTTDAFGCPATKWTLKNSDVGTYLATVDKVYYNEDVTAGQVYNDLGLTASAPLTFYVNGVDVTKSGSTISKNDQTKLSALITTANTIGNGVEVRAFRTDSGSTPSVVLSAVVYYPGTVASVRSATETRGRYITINGVGDTRAPSALSATNNQFETEDFETGDIVAYTFSAMPGKTGIQSVELLDNESGALTRVNTATGLVLDGNTYENALNIVYGNAEGTENALAISNNYNIYLFTLDGKEMVMWVENVQASANSYAWVKNLSNGRQDFDYAQAKLVFSNGSEQAVSLSTYVVDDVDALNHHVVTYSVDSNDRYTLKPLETTSGALTVKNRNAAGLPEGIVADNDTTFIVEDSASKTYKVYSGMRNTPNIKTDNAYVYSANGSAVMVFVSNATITTSKGDVIFIAANSATNPVRAKSTYRTFNAVVGGQITKVNVLVDSVLGNDGENPKSGAQFTVSNDSVKPAPESSVILDNTEYNADELIIGGTYNNANVTVGRVQGLAAPSNGAIRLGGSKGALMDLSNSVNVYSVSTSGLISKINLSNVKADSEAWVYYTLDNKDITNLFILRVEAK
ncbi:MAG: S-layer homology domain-containing protein [Oscillibacter sp.]|nr:S-layer homology domain-containing protein [Oscillibacter sp.]